jgi:AraC-like DNA-binding protein
MHEILIDATNERRNLDLRTLGLTDVPLLGRYHYVTAHEPLTLRSHGNRLEICYLESGQQSYIIDGQQVDVSGGDLFVTFPHEQHGTGDLPQGRGALFWTLVRVPERNERFLSLPPEEGRLILNRLLHLPQRCFRGGKVTKQTLYRIFAAYDRVDDPLRIVSVRNLLIRFFLDVLEASNRTEGVVSPLIRDIRHSIDKNLNQPLTVADLARRAELSESHFKARFKAETGMSPGDYVLRKKIELAQALLLGSNHSVLQVAMSLGFSSSQYFATVFKRYTGQTPSAFRDEVKE